MHEAALAVAPTPPRGSRDQLVLRWGLRLALAFLVCFLALPLGALLLRAFETPEGGFAGFGNFRAYFTTAAVLALVWNSLWTSALTAMIVVPAAFAYAYALTRGCIPAKPLFRAVMMLPMLAPSLLPALALIHLFGNHGLLRGLLMGGSIYGPIGIVAAQVFYCFPSAAMILTVALATADARLYEAGAALKASRARIFWTVTLPNARYGLVSAFVVVFTLVLTDVGIPTVIGGQFPVLATEVYRQVVGLQDFNMGAVVGLLLVIPAVLAFLLDRWARRRRAATMCGRGLPLRPAPSVNRDRPLLAFCILVAALLLAIIGVAVWGSLVRVWPHNLALTLDNYDFSRFDTADWDAVWISVRMASLVAAIGTVIVFTAAYVLERGAQEGRVPAIVRFAALVPLAVPGLVLGLAYVLFFSEATNLLGILHGTLAILVLNSIVHLYTAGHLTAVTAIRQLDREFEAVGASLRIPVWVTFARVTVPMCLPAILEIAVYLFVNAMTTVSAVIFLYGPDTKPASVAMVHMNEAGHAGAAAAVGVAILAITIVAKLGQMALGTVLGWRTSAWRR